MIAALCFYGYPMQQQDPSQISARAESWGAVGSSERIITVRLVGKRACDRHRYSSPPEEPLGQSMFAVTNFEIVEQLNGAGAGAAAALTPASPSTTATLSLPSRNGSRLGTER